MDVISVGVYELQRAADCPGDEEFARLKGAAAGGDPGAQYELGLFYIRHVSGWSEYHESAERVGGNLLHCAAEGGSHGAQGYLGTWGPIVQNPERWQISYKFARLSGERRDCDCAASPSVFGACYQLCSTIEWAREKLSTGEIEELEREIAAFEPVPTACEVEIVAE